MKYEEEHKYDRILNLPHPVSKEHPPMPLSNRAAQFSPFAALTGHEELIREAARLTDSFIELDEDQKEQLNQQLRTIREHLEQEPECEITYFQPDAKKDGGAYVTLCGKIKKIDEYTRRILLTDGTVLPVMHLFSIRGELFEQGEA